MASRTPRRRVALLPDYVRHPRPAVGRREPARRIRALLLAASGLVVGTGVFSLTIAGALVLASCGTLRPMMYGMALGLFDRDLGLTGGLVSAVCHLAVGAAMAVAAVLRESSRTPLDGLYVVLGIATFFLLPTALPRTVAPPPRLETTAS